MFNEGFVSSTGATQDRDLAADAVWLAEVVATSLPDAGRGLGAGRAAHHPARPGGGALRRDRGAGAAARPGPLAGGTPPRSASGRRTSSGPPRSTRPAATSCRPRSPPATPPAPRGRRPTGCRSSRCTTSCVRHDPSPVPRLNRAVALAQLGPEQAEGARRRSTRSPTGSTATTSSTPTRAELLDRLGPRRRGGRGQPPRPRAHHQRRRAPAADHPPAPPPADRRVVSRIVRREKHPCGGAEGAFHGGLSRSGS